MKNSKTKLMAIAASAALVAMLGLAACGGGSSSASSSAASAASSNASTAATSQSATATASNATTTAASGQTVDVSSWTDAWMGVSDKGETFYYAESPDGSQGAMLVYEPSTNQYVSYVGDTSTPQEGYVRITDIQSGNALQFEVTAGDKEGNVVIDLGDLGNAVLAKCNISEVMKCFQSIDTYGNAVA